MTKVELRKIYLAKQKNLSSSERIEKSRQITGQFFQSFDLSKIRFLHCFIAIKKFNEVDTSLIFKRLWREFPQVQALVPRINFQTREIENLKFTLETKLVENAWKIKEPTESESVKTKEIDMVLIPLLCFDEKGFRVGYGKGFYDKFLSDCREDVLKIGLSFFDPIGKIADAQEFDVKLDFCVTPKKIVNCK
ncbi:MAG: 5-formyltetrahydrofolate cyclo-ligase [Acidobacteria bacterium]|nr:5-formyltetrahydrofolate cyclo-ligase [Acidobacteriota bacterium]MCA1637199.1 5-formyltetrahydrofolate cyclo-ligase [Acidobacteriota bacterium]